MAFTQTAMTINNVAGSILIDGSGNLTDLINLGVAGITATSPKSIVIDGGGIQKLYAIHGLQEQRDGVFDITVTNGAHLCFGFQAGKDPNILGTPPNSNGISISSVNIVYTQTAPRFGDAYKTAAGKCFVGQGALDFHSGSVLFNQAPDNQWHPFDIFINGEDVLFDKVHIFAKHNHFFSRSNIVTTSRTRFSTQPAGNFGFPWSLIGEGITLFPAISTTNGIEWLNPSENQTARAIKPAYRYATIYTSIARGATLQLVDPDRNYLDEDIRKNTSTHRNILEIYRTLKVNFRDQLGAGIENSKLISVHNESATVDNSAFDQFVDFEYLQSTKPANLRYTDTGVGYTDETEYDFYVVSFGYAAQLKNVDVKTSYDGNDGIAWLPVATKSTAVECMYEDVVTTGFLFNVATGTLTVTEDKSALNASEYLFKLAYDDVDHNFWLALDHTPVSRVAESFDFGGINLVVDGATFTGNLTTTGTVTLLNGATIDGAVEDANGVRVTIRRADNLAFNLVARHGTEGDYVDLGFHENTTTQTFTVPKGRPVEFALKTKGWATVRRTLQTADGGVVFEVEPIFNEAVDTSLDVTGFMENISLSNGGGVFNFVFEADMDVPGIEVAKTLIDDLVSQELALRSTLPPGTGTIIDILSDEIRINQPVVQLILGAGANNVTQRGFINIAPALAVNPNYVINPRRPADNLRVDLPLNKPTLDPTVLALAVRAEMERDGGGLHTINNGVKKASLLIPHAEDL